MRKTANIIGSISYDGMGSVLYEAAMPSVSHYPVSGFDTRWEKPLRVTLGRKYISGQRLSFKSLNGNGGTSL
jgi:hypothetical protein